MNRRGPFSAAIFPGASANIFIDADAAGLPSARCKIWNDHRDMANFSDDRILFICFALTKARWVDMQIGDDSSTALAAIIPQIPKLAAVDNYDARTERGRIDVVVKNKLFNNDATLALAPQQNAPLSRTPADLRRRSSMPAFQVSALQSSSGGEPNTARASVVIKDRMKVL